MQKKDDKVGNKTANKEGKEGKKESERERSKCLFFLQNSFLAMLINRKLVQRRGIGEKCSFFATRRRSPLRG